MLVGGLRGVRGLVVGGVEAGLGGALGVHCCMRFIFLSGEVRVSELGREVGWEGESRLLVCCRGYDVCKCRIINEWAIGYMYA